MHRQLICAALFSVAMASARAQEPYGPKPGVTVTVFELGAAASHARATSRRYPGPYDHPDAEMAAQFVDAVGTGVADLVVEKLIASERFRVYERRQGETMQREQAIERGDRTDVERARYLVTGSISLLGDDDRDIGAIVAGAAGQSLGLGAGLSSLFTNTRRTTMRVTVRVVDTNTGEIIGSFTSEGRSKTRWSGSFASIGSGGVKAGSMASRSFRATAIGEAGDRAASDIAERLIAMRAQRLRP